MSIKSWLPRRLCTAAPGLGLLALVCAAVLCSAQAPIQINEYPLPQVGSNPWIITPGPDGALWYTVSCPYIPTCPVSVFDAIGRITPSGTITEYPLPGPSYGHGPYGIVAGPDGALWFTEMQANKIGRITTSGVITEYPVPTSNAAPYKIAVGPDGALWFTEMHERRIGRISIDGLITEYPVPGACCSTDPTDIVAGPDGALWFTNLNSSWIGRMTTQGDLTKYSLPMPSPDYGIAVGPDNALWFTGGISTTGLIWRITTDGVFSSFNVPTNDPGLIYITMGPDKALWFTETYAGKIGRVTTDGVFSEYPVQGTFSAGPVAITAGPDGNIWYGKWGYIGRIVISDKTAPALNVAASPSLLRPRDGRMVPVTISGKVTDAGSGVMANSLEYTVSDEYGLIQPKGHMSFDSAGNYSFTILLRASCEHNDLDGRLYTIRVNARDNAGNRAVKWVSVRAPL
jgi:virginiamycin B lyase